MDMYPEPDNVPGYELPFEADGGLGDAGYSDAGGSPAEWEYDSAQAIIDAQQAFEVATETGYAASALDIVAAPEAAELDARGVLELADDGSQIDFLQDTLRAQLDSAGTLLPLEQTDQYAECVLEHRALAMEYEKRLGELKGLMTDVAVEKTDYGTCQLAVFEGTYLPPSNQVAPVTHAVRLHFDPQGRLIDPNGYPAMTVTTETQYGSAKVQKPFIPCDADKYPQYGDFKALALSAGAFGLDVHDTARRLTGKAQRAAIEPWVDGYMALPEPLAWHSVDDHFGASHMPYSARALLGNAPVTRQAAGVALFMAFGPVSEGDVQADRNVASSEVIDALQTEGIAERYTWMLRNARDIRDATVAAHNEALNSGLADAYRESILFRRAALERLTALVADLRQMHLRPVELTSSVNDERLRRVKKADGVFGPRGVVISIKRGLQRLRRNG